LKRALALVWEGSRRRSQKRKDIEDHLTQSQLSELLETESARTLLEAGEERGWIEPAELEAFVVENDLAEPDAEELVRELEKIGLEVREPVTEEKNKKAQPEPVIYEAYSPSCAPSLAHDQKSMPATLRHNANQLDSPVLGRRPPGEIPISASPRVTVALNPPWREWCPAESARTLERSPSLSWPIRYASSGCVVRHLVELGDSVECAHPHG
jgi:hypothetical protein